MFPAEIYFEILLRLPVKSACICKCVSKNWLSLISDPSFVKSHLDFAIQTNNPSLILQGIEKTSNRNRDVMYSISHDSLPSLLSTEEEFLEYAVEMDYPFKSSLYESVELVGCFDGLVCLWFCFSDSHRNFLCLWNPATKEYKELPKSPNAKDEEDFSMIGLVYDCKSGDYKLVARPFDSVVEVYSLRFNSWTSIENVPYNFNSHRNVGVLCSRDLHWLAQAQGCSKVIVSLDIGDQLFKEIQLPNEPWVNKNDYDFTLGLLEGCLSVHVNIANVNSEVWVMQANGVQESWTKRHIINHERINEHLPILMWSFKSGEILLGFLDSEDLVVYDPKDKSVREPNVPGLTQLYQEGCYFESLVSLGSGTYVGGEEEEGRA